MLNLTNIHFIHSWNRVYDDLYYLPYSRKSKSFRPFGLFYFSVCIRLRLMRYFITVSYFFRRRYWRSIILRLELDFNPSHVALAMLKSLLQNVKNYTRASVRQNFKILNFFKLKKKSIKTMNHSRMRTQWLFYSTFTLWRIFFLNGNNRIWIGELCST